MRQQDRVRSPQIAFSESLAERIRQRLARRKNVEEKKMFGGIGFLLNGNMPVGVWKDSLIVRLGPEQSEEALKAAHASGLKLLQNRPRGP
jgi:TfoX/Sxy family transcriptional regulator of competence genes